MSNAQMIPTAEALCEDRKHRLEFPWTEEQGQQVTWCKDCGLDVIIAPDGTIGGDATMDDCSRAEDE